MRRTFLLATLPPLVGAAAVVACVGEEPILLSPLADAAVESASPVAAEDSAIPTPPPTHDGATSSILDAGSPDARDVCKPTPSQNCACTGDIDLCRANAISSADAGTSPTYDPNAYTMFTMPPNPKANVPFDLFIVTKNRSLVAPGLLKNGAICYGGGLSKPCPSVGAGCDGWKVGFFRGVSEPAGTYQFAIKDPQGPTGCEGPTIAATTVIVSN